MSEALSTVIEYGFNELDLQEIVAITSSLNENSKKLLLKLYFILKKGKKDEHNPDNIIFSLNRD